MKSIGTVQPDHAEAHDLMRGVYLLGCEKINQLVADLWQWGALPARFEIGGEKWEAMEDAIAQAAERGAWWTVVDLGTEYLARIDRFCAAWREQANTKTKGATK